MLLKLRQPYEALEGRVLHARTIAETHVVGHQGTYLPGFVVGEAEATADFLSHGRADFRMLIETDAVRRAAKGRRLSNVVQERSQRQGPRAARRQAFEKHQRVDPDITF